RPGSAPGRASGPAADRTARSTARRAHAAARSSRRVAGVPVARHDRPDRSPAGPAPPHAALMPRRHARLVCGLLLAGAACRSAPAIEPAKGGPPIDDAPAREAGRMITAAFRCSDSSEVLAIFRTDSVSGSVSLAIGDDRMLLPQVVSADGGRYA